MYQFEQKTIVHINQEHVSTLFKDLNTMTAKAFYLISYIHDFIMNNYLLLRTYHLTLSQGS